VNPIFLLSKSRGIKNLFARIISVLNRFSYSSEKFEQLLNRYYAVTRSLGCVPTFPIPAAILKRYVRLIKRYSQEKIDFAVHGYIHADYGTKSLAKQKNHFKKAIDIFKHYQIPFHGFRAPYLSINSETPQALSGLEFSYDSSRSINWDILDATKYTKAQWDAYTRLLDYYRPMNARDYLALPKFNNGFIEIPVSIPDDEAIVDRLDITDEDEINQIWQIILEKTYQRGELFTVQLHPERIAYFENTLRNVLKKARGLNPPVWIASLAEITSWWQERNDFAFKIQYMCNNRFRVQAKCSDRATVLAKNSRVNVPAEKWFDGAEVIEARDFTLESPVRPVIGVRPDSPVAATNFLRSEGYLIESSDRPGDYGIYFDSLAQFDETQERSLSREIDKSDAPLIRYWRWPDRARSALSVTGDIDSITLFDFVSRILQNSYDNLFSQRRKRKPYYLSTTTGTVVKDSL
jgi:peptidoglycan/xylan/chitin deacetylase (PgdA/CDA1 family)